MIIKNYNSTNLLSDYTIGNAYTFYVHNLNLGSLANANEKTIKKYSSILTEISNDNSYAYNNGKYLNLTRAIGVVVDKHKANNYKDIDKITVMFKTDDERYVINTYVVNSTDIFTNNKNSVPPVAMLCIA